MVALLGVVFGFRCRRRRDRGGPAGLFGRGPGRLAILLEPVEPEETEAEEDHGREERDHRRLADRSEVTLEDHEAVQRVARVALGLGWRDPEGELGRVDRLDRAELHDCVQRLVGELEVEEAGFAPTGFPGLHGEVVGDDVEPSELLGRARFLVGGELDLHELGVDEGLHVGRLDGVYDPALLLDVAHSGGLRFGGVGDDLLGDPLRDVSLERVQRRRGGHPQRAEQHHERHQAGERDEEPEPGAEVRAQQEVDRTAEQPDAGDDDEHPDDRGVPES
jgi:hypothetical protein